MSRALLGLAGWSGSGKTTLLDRLIPALTARGLRVATLKHAHHDFDTDRPGKDSWRHRRAGAREVMVSSANRWALVHELAGDAEPGFEDLLARMSPADLVLVEGFKRAPIPKLEIYRAELGKPLMARDDANIIAIVTAPPLGGTGLPQFAPDDIDGIAEFAAALARRAATA